MRFVNTYRNSAEEIPDGFDPESTGAVHLGYLPGHCAPGREYNGALAGLPMVHRKAARFEYIDRGFIPVRWVHLPEEMPR